MKKENNIYTRRNANLIRELKTLGTYFKCKPDIEEMIESIQSNDTSWVFNNHIEIRELILRYKKEIKLLPVKKSNKKLVIKTVEKKNTTKRKVKKKRDIKKKPRYIGDINYTAYELLFTKPLTKFKLCDLKDKTNYNRILCGIYIFTNLDEDKKYIGLSRDIKSRLNQHINSRTILGRKLNTHKNFIIEIYEFGESLLSYCEKLAINFHKTYLPENGYNLTLGG